MAAIDPTIPLWPAILGPQKVVPKRKHPVNFGPEVISGPPQSVAADAGRWELSYSQIPLFRDRVLAFRAVVADLCTALSPVYVPMRDYLRTPRRRAGVALPGGVPFSDGATFSDGSMFYDQPVDFIVSTSAAARAVNLTVTRQGPTGVELTAGNFIGLGDRSYVIRKIFPSLTVTNGFDLTLWPYLRAAAVAGDAVWTEDPVVKCLIAPDAVETADDIDFGAFGYVDMTFIEARWP